MTTTADGAPVLEQPAQAAPPEAAAVLMKLADEDMAAGHVLTSVAGWGPELEVNIALSSMGQDELGHARAFYSLALGPDRSAINAAIYDRPAEEFQACALAWVYDVAWERLAVKQFLFETADSARRGVLLASELEGLAANLSRMEAEERFHVDFWSSWLARTAASGGPALAKLQGALDELWPFASAMFAFDAGALEAVLPGGQEAMSAALLDWEGTAREQLGSAGLVVPAPGAPRLAEAGGEAPSGPWEDRLRIVGELHSIYDQAPGRW